MIGSPVFMREILSHSRRPRTYVFQTIFLAVMVVCLIPLWPAGGSQSGADLASKARSIFEYGGYLQIILLALLAPAITANAIVEEKASNTLDLLLLTGTGPFAIVLGKFISRLYVLLFLLFLTLPILFALLTLGGVSGSTILIELCLLIGFAVLSAGLGIFLSTLLPRVTGALLTGYLLLGLLIGSPLLLVETGILPASVFAGSASLYKAYLSPLYTMLYVFRPTQFVSTESVASMWWVTPAWNVGAGFALVVAAGLLLPYARAVETLFSLKQGLETIDRLTFLLLRPSLLLKGVRPGQVELPARERVPDAGDEDDGAMTSAAAVAAAQALTEQAEQDGAPPETAPDPGPAVKSPPATRGSSLALHGIFLGLLAPLIVGVAYARARAGFGLTDVVLDGLGAGVVWLATYVLTARSHLRRPLLILGPAVVALAVFTLPAVGLTCLGLLWVGHWLSKPAPGARSEAAAAEVEASRSLGRANPIYWKETTVNTIGRFRYWWRINLAILVCMLGSYWFFNQVNLLDKIEFQKTVVAVLAGLIVILSTIIAATTVSKEREDGTLVLLATTPIDCATYVEGKARGIARNIVFLVALPFVHVTIFVLAGVISPWTLIFLLLSIPIAAAASIVQGIFVSLLFPTTMRAIMWSIVVLIVEAILPLVCCLPQFNLPLACYFMVEPASGMAAAGTGGGTNFITAMLLASVFGGSTQLGYTFVVYSLIRSGFDRYIGRAA